MVQGLEADLCCTHSSSNLSGDDSDNRNRSKTIVAQNTKAMGYN